MSQKIIVIRTAEPVTEAKPTMTIGIVLERAMITVIASAIFWPLVAIFIRLSA